MKHGREPDLLYVDDLLEGWTPMMKQDIYRPTKNHVINEGQMRGGIDEVGGRTSKLVFKCA